MGSHSLFRRLAHSQRKFVKVLQNTLSRNRYSGLDRWIVKGVKTRFGASMSVWLYDLVWTVPFRTVVRSNRHAAAMISLTLARDR